MQAWIKENQVTSILIGAVILLTLMIGYQSNQINQLQGSKIDGSGEVSLEIVRTQNSKSHGEINAKLNALSNKVYKLEKEVGGHVGGATGGYQSWGIHHTHNR